MAVVLKTVKAKLPVKWAAHGETLPSGKKVTNEDGQVISEEKETQVPQLERIEDSISHFGGEKEFLEFVNSAMAEKETRRQYQNLLAQVKPSNLSQTERIDRAIAAMVKTGFYTIDEATAEVQKRAAAGKL